jgi:hypothetical protein
MDTRLVVIAAPLLVAASKSKLERMSHINSSIVYLINKN